MTLGSLFDGSGGFPLAGAMCGITPVWASEIEPFPVAVTTKRFPNMVQLGDITKINGADIATVDVITFGSPCQGLSCAGLQKGLEDERSGLFMEAIRIIKEMRAATDGRYPAYAIWENVPGAFSSNKGEDFYTVLKEFCKIKTAGVSVPRPVKRKGRNAGLKWNNAGLVVGDSYSIAWRVLDSKFWGVPQRRRRIFLVADFGGQRVGEILFKREGLSRHFAQIRKAWQGAAEAAEMGTGEADRANVSGIAYSFDSLASNSMKSSNPHSGCREVEIAKTLDTSYPDPGKNQGGIAIVQAYGFKGKAGSKAGTIGYTEETAPTLQAEQNCHVLICDARGNGDGNISPTMTGDHNGHISDYTAICIVGNTIDRRDENGGNGTGCQENVSYTLNTVDRYTVAYEQQAYDKYVDSQISGTLKAQGGSNGGGSETLAVTLDCRNDAVNDEMSGTLQAKKGGGYSLNYTNPVFCKLKDCLRYIVRRLTPLECCRLQGFPDFWCSDIPHADAPEYKMWGNGVALPCVLYVMEGVAGALERIKNVTD